MKQLLLLAFLSCSFLTGTAQQLRTAYFMDKATLRTSMNPALRPARGFISIPAAGSISATYASNGVALGDLLYQKDGRLDRKSTRLNSSHDRQSRMPSSA